MLLLWTALGFTALAQTARLTEEQLRAVRVEYGGAAVTRLADWIEVIGSGAGLPERRKLELVNDFFNRLRFVDDSEHWGRRDYWATPVEFLATAGGDCEDFSIAKYFTLKEMGVPMDKMRITYVTVAGRRNPAHMVLTYYATPDAEPLILDNLIDRIKTGSERPDLTPVYSFNGEGLWKAIADSRGRRIGAPTGLFQWRDLLRRMERERSLELNR